jgi:polysaccharide export outer membrane protein
MSKSMKNVRIWLVCAAIGLVLPAATGAQTASRPPQASDAGANAAATPLPRGYVIGVDDDLSIKFWKDTELSADVTVRPDGKVSLPLLNDVQADGFTPEQLNEQLSKAASKFIADPSVTVMVKAIRSRKVYVLGEVGKPGAVPLNGEMNVLQLIATVGGLLEYADKENIAVVRTENGKEQRFRFNYNNVIRGKDVGQNIILKPGDTIIVR